MVFLENPYNTQIFFRENINFLKYILKLFRPLHIEPYILLFHQFSILDILVLITTTKDFAN